MFSCGGRLLSSGSSPWCLQTVKWRTTCYWKKHDHRKTTLRQATLFRFPLYANVCSFSWVPFFSVLSVGLWTAPFSSFLPLGILKAECASFLHFQFLKNTKTYNWNSIAQTCDVHKQNNEGNISCAYVFSFHQKMISKCCENKMDKGHT